jgi:feruloyl esterase
MMRSKWLAAVLLSGLGGIAASASSGHPADSCAGLGRLGLEDTTLSAGEEPASFVHPSSIFDVMGKPRAGGQSFCRAQGLIHGRVRFEVWLPAARVWNGRLQGVGNGGMAGAIPYPALLQALQAGYAVVGSDLGHQSDFVESGWATGHPESIRDWGHLATHEMTVRARAIARAYYGVQVRWSYFTGCSGGGRQGLMEAQRYPGDYNGIVAGDPTINFVRLTTAGRLWMALQLSRPDGGSTGVPPAKLALITRAVTAQCDAQDGVADGVLDDPRSCRFEPATLLCKGADRDDCLTPQQARSLQKIYAGATDSTGKKLFPGYEPGSETGFSSGQWTYAAGFLHGLAFERPDFDPRAFDFDRDIVLSERRDVGGETLSEAIDAGNPDLNAFRALGGKLIQYHGWSDPGVPPRNSVDYYERVLANAGHTRTRDFYRLFMVPGMGHCGGGPGTTTFDMLPALVSWVEHGRAPDSVPATHIEAGQVIRSRPLCPYPERAVWNRSGNQNDIANYSCRTISN